MIDKIINLLIETNCHHYEMLHCVSTTALLLVLDTNEREHLVQRNIKEQLPKILKTKSRLCTKKKKFIHLRNNFHSSLHTIISHGQNNTCCTIPWKCGSLLNSRTTVLNLTKNTKTFDHQKGYRYG